MARLAQINGSELFFHYSIETVLEESRDYILHGHSQHEIYYMVGGKINYLIEGKKYILAPGSLLLMKPGVLHGYKLFPGESYERYAIQFNEDYIMPEYREEMLKPFSQENGKLFQGADIFSIASMFDSFILASKMEGENQKKAARFALHAMLCYIKDLNDRRKSGIPTEKAGETVMNIISYINSHFTEQITLDRLSADYFINKNHLNRVFRSVTGTTVKEYIIRKRIVYSQQLMRKGISAADAGIKCGFGDYSAFFRAYRRINGHSPSTDRIKHLKI